MDEDKFKFFQNFDFNQPIDWPLIFSAYNFYKDHFLYQDVPYFVPTNISNYTKPHNSPDFILQNGFFNNNEHELIGSAEQGFIYLMETNLLKNNKLFSISPCFRSETYNQTHFPQFIKLELFHLSDSIDDLNKIIDLAFSFFESKSFQKPEIVQTNINTYDINLNNIEIGSYGFRKINEKTFIYGTGLALPRFSQANIKIGE